MKQLRFLMIFLCLSILCSACSPPFGQDEMLLEYFDSMVSDALPTPAGGGEPTQSGGDGVVYGFGMGSSTHIRLEDEFATAYDEMREMGVRMIREEFPMVEIQQSADSYNFDLYGGFDRMVGAAEARDLQILALLAYGPSVSYADDAEFISLWEGYVGAVVDRYGDRIDHWEIGNEMNSLPWWQEVRTGATHVEANVYAAMLESAYRIIKSHDPQDVVIIGGLINHTAFPGGYDPLAFVKEVGKYSSGRYFDAIAFHTYWQDSLPETRRPQMLGGSVNDYTMREYVTAFAQKASQFYGVPVPIWVTEVGYSQADLDSLSAEYRLPADDIQAITLFRTYTGLLAQPEVEAVFWYTYVNDKTSQQFALKPISKIVFRTLVDALSSTSSLGRHSVEDAQGQPVEHVFEYRFLKPYGDTVSIYWKNDPRSDFLTAAVTNLVETPALGYEIDGGMNVHGIVVDEGITQLGIYEEPQILVGGMDANTRLVIGGKQTQALEQIIYQQNGNIWRYDMANDNAAPLTTDGSENWEGINYFNLHLSPDGRYLAFNREGESQIMDLQDDHITSLGEKVDFLGWTDESGEFYGVTGDMACPPIENLEEQTEMEIQIVQFSLSGSGSTTILGHVGGGMHMAEAVSTDGQWLAVRYCLCYSECGGLGILHLPSGQGYGSPTGTEIALGGFSPDSLQVAFFEVAMWNPLKESTLYTAQSNLSNARPLFFETNVVPRNVTWSPDGDWIGFTAITQSGDQPDEFGMGYEEVGRRAVVVRADGSEQITVDHNASFMAWGPEGNRVIIRRGTGASSNYVMVDLGTNTRESLPLTGDLSMVIWGKMP